MTIKIDFYKDPTVIRIKNVFPTNVSNKIFQEVLKNKNNFVEARVGNLETNRRNEKIRNNKSMYYDKVYDGKREKSILLSSISKLFTDSGFVDMMNSSPDPFNKFQFTNTHETQVSRYGDSGQRYSFHVDFIGDSRRLITFVYYFGGEKFKGGEIEFIDSPISMGKPLVKDANTLKIRPKPNEGYIFSSSLAHRVNETISPKIFKDGRFSVNCWIGVKN